MWAVDAIETDETISKLLSAVFISLRVAASGYSYQLPENYQSYLSRFSKVRNDRFSISFV